MDWKNYYRMVNWLGLILLLAVSCSPNHEKDTKVFNEPFTGFEAPGSLLVANDTQASGLGENWFIHDNFPQSAVKEINSFRSDDLATYTWLQKEFRVGSIDSVKQLYLILKHVNGEFIIWLNGQLIRQISGNFPLEYFPVKDYIVPGTSNFLTMRYRSISEGQPVMSGFAMLPYENDEALNEANQVKNTETLPFEQAAFASDLVIYELFLRDFTPNGTFNGLQNRVEYLKDLGVNMVWLMPIHPVGIEKKKGSYGSPYAVKNYFMTNPNMGSRDQFKEMLTIIHKNKIRLIIDAVVNHTSWDNSLMTQHPEFYTKNSKGEIISPAGTNWTDVADLDYNVPALQDYMASYFSYWMNDVGIDGFRCDVAGMVPGSFWNKTISGVRLKHPDLFMLAEATEKELLMDGFNAVYSWDLYHAFQEVHAGQKDPAAITELLFNEQISFPKNSLIMHYAENHDTERAAKTLGHTDHHLALITVFTAPGIPMIYCGEELGSTERLDIFEKKTLILNKRHLTTYQLVQNLIRLRKNEPALRYGELSLLSGNASYIGFRRITANDTLSVLINYGDSNQFVDILSSKSLLNNSESLWSATGVRLSPKGYMILK